jgi:hypothetical protein
MGSAEMLDEVSRLRQEGRTPKEIARALNIRPAEATRLVRAAAARAESPESPVLGCWINQEWNVGLLIDGEPAGAEEWAGVGGLAQILVARRHRHDKVKVCGYLVDVFCLGMKNTYGPEVMDELGLHRFVATYYSAFESEPVEVPIELARDIVFGGVEYARNLGFEPHREFVDVADHLGTWNGSSSITFGKNGKPFYVSGPNDNPNSVIRTLAKSAGEGNFDVVLTLG